MARIVYLMTMVTVVSTLLACSSDRSEIAD